MGGGVRQQRDKILTFYTSARARDMQCVALAYSPLHLRPDHPLLTTPARALWIHAPPNGPGDVRAPATSVRAAMGCRGRVPSGRRLTLSRSHVACPVSPPAHQPEQELVRILAGQTFLGMVVLQHEIKEDIPYLVEALNTAGVHFTYFSRLSERESKQHASQIGLETDWNCCISLANDEADPGDAQDKAQMPRGIDKVGARVPKLERTWASVTPLRRSPSPRLPPLPWWSAGAGPAAPARGRRHPAARADLCQLHAVQHPGNDPHLPRVRRSRVLCRQLRRPRQRVHLCNGMRAAPEADVAARAVLMPASRAASVPGRGRRILACRSSC